jgi:hypothetical protein
LKTDQYSNISSFTYSIFTGYILNSTIALLNFPKRQNRLPIFLSFRWFSLYRRVYLSWTFFSSLLTASKDFLIVVWIFRPAGFGFSSFLDLSSLFSVFIFFVFLILVLVSLVVFYLYPCCLCPFYLYPYLFVLVFVLFFFILSSLGFFKHLLGQRIMYLVSSSEGLFAMHFYMLLRPQYSFPFIKTFPKL